MLESLLEREYALGCNVVEDIIIELGCFPNPGKVEDVTIVSWNWATWNNK